MKLIYHIKSILKKAANLEEVVRRYKYAYYDVKHIPSKYTLERIAEIRKKDKIKVAFIVYDIPKWKTEDLYLEMLKHPRFNPVLVPILYHQYDYVQVCNDFNRCIEYFKTKGYPFIPGNRRVSIDTLVQPDIVFYGEHYNDLFDSGYTVDYKTRRKSLGCHVQYCFKNLCIKETVDKPQSNLIWMSFYENDSVINDMRPIMSNGAKNYFSTGLPIQDAFERSFVSPKDVWKHQSHRKVRLIWAPSYSIPNSNWNIYEQSTFLDMADEMIGLAEQNKDVLQIAFKPHPLLRPRLNIAWGRERTDAYYAKWAEMENTQLEEGQYVDLFMSSDAMVHDCMSFTVEYMYTGKPVLFLDKGAGSMDMCNTQTNEAFTIHYKGKGVLDVERFINKVVVEGDDPLKVRRLEFKQKYLRPPYGRTACQNIISAILGEKEFAPTTNGG